MRKKKLIKVLASALAMILTLNTAAPAAVTVYAAEVEETAAVDDETTDETVVPDQTDVETDTEETETPTEGEDAETETPAEGEDVEAETPAGGEDAETETPEEGEDVEAEIPAEGEESEEDAVVDDETVVEEIAEEETNEDDTTEEETDEITTTDYKTFLSRLKILEEYAADYASTHDGEDETELVINYVRTGVERYLSGSWIILSGTEKTDFTRYVEQQDEANGTEVRGLKNLEEFRIPNGDTVDFGHMFGTMNITYYMGKTNPTAATIYADLSGWGGDLSDLMEETVNLVEVDDIEVMTADIKDNYLAADPSEASGFDIVDVYGDLDGFYIMNSLDGGKKISKVMENYFNTSLTDRGRALFFVKTRFGALGSQAAFRTAVYEAYSSNDMLKNLEASKELSNIDELRQACCYAFGDYLFELTGTLSDTVSNEYYAVFDSEKSTLAPGITQQIDYARTTVDDKQIVYYIATADITRDDVDVYANYGENDGSVWKMVRVSDQMKAAEEKHSNPEDPDNYIPNYTAVVGVNADFYNMSTGQPSGALVMEGVQYQGANSESFFAILDDGTPILASASEWSTYKDRVKEAVGGNPWLIKDGKIAVTATSSYYTSRVSRTCVGITADNKVVVMVLDGRQEPFSAGGSAIEMAQIMYEAGCVQAINLDGGGSTTFVAKQEGSDELTVVNSPSDGYERSVSSSLMIVSTAKPSNEFDHGLVLSSYDYLTVGTSIDITTRGVNVSGGSAELPEGTYLQVTDETIGTLEDGVFTALTEGDVELQLIANGTVVGKKTLHVVTPDTIAFEKEHMNAVYGVTTELPLLATYKGNAVAINGNDVVTTLEDGKEAAGTLTGLNFIGNEESGIRSVAVIALLAENQDIYTAISINLYKADEAYYDFDKATAGDRAFSWRRDVTNANSSDDMTFYIEDMDEEVTVSYTFGIDMKEIEIPEQLIPLVAMLPGGDNPDATAWDFLLSLAERIGTKTRVEVELTFDECFDVDYSELAVVNEYFSLTEYSFDEETNTLKAVFNWIDQTQAIDSSTANSICILSGITLTPKEGTDPVLEPVNSGSVKYDIYLRANAVYNMMLDEANQELYGVYPYELEDVLYQGEPERGGHFMATFATFADEIVIDRTGKEGWVKEENGNLYYYVNNVKCTGIHELPGYLEDGTYYYDLGDDGVYAGKVNGLFELDDHLYYAELGKLKTGWNNTRDASGTIIYYYFDPTNGYALDGTQTIGGYTYEFTDYVLTKGQLVKDSTGTRYMWAGDWATQQWLTIDGNVSYATQSGYFRTGFQHIPGPDGVYRWYIFDEDGVWRQELNGMFDADLDGVYEEDEITYYAENGIWIEYPGIVKIDGDFYYFKSDGSLLKNAENYYISKSNEYMPLGSYSFDADGKMIDPPVYPSSITLSDTSVEINKGKYYTLSATLKSDVENDEGMITTVTWTSSNTEVATVNRGTGQVKGVAAGTATITATTPNGKTATCTVIVLVPSTKVELSDSEVTIARGSKAALTAVMTPEDTTDALTWTTSDEAIATVSAEGEVTAVEKGTATITATTTSGKTASCTVTVNVPVESMTVGAAELTLNKGETADLTAAVTPEDATDALTWTTSDEAVAAVADGKVTAVGGGTAEITVTAESGAKAVCTVTVKVPAESITLNAAELTINKSETAKAEVTVNPADATDALTWTTSNEAVATVDADGNITAAAAGTAEITVTAESGVSAVCTVNVKVPAESVTLNKTELNLIKGEEESLTAVLAPEDTTDVLTWTTSDETVATVADGKVTAVGAGTAEITATATSGVKAVCTVDVKVPAAGITLSETEVAIHNGVTYALTAVMTPADATDTLTWTTSDETVAIVSAEGVITAVGAGTAVITVKTEEGYEAVCTVTVKTAADSITLSDTKLSILPNGNAELTATLTPANVDDEITWTTSDETVITVTAEGEKATVTANKIGTAVVTATTKSGKSAECIVVVEIPADSIELNKTAVTMYKGEADVLIYTMLPVDTTDEVTWTSSDETIATVSSYGEVDALKEGTATITATTTSGKTASCDVTVIGVPAITVTLNKKAVSINRGKTAALKAKLTPADVTDEVIWTSSDESVATVDENGVVTAVSGINGKNTAVIKATTLGGAYAECTVTVKDVRSTSVKLSKTALSLNVGKTSTLKATMSKGTTDTVTWTSSNEEVATVAANGKVTAVAAGTAIIKAETTSGLKAECTVTVKLPATQVVLNETAVTLTEGDKLTLEAVMSPEGTTDTLTWKSSKASVATVSENGEITAVAKGSATITVTTTSGKKATCKVTVVKPVDFEPAISVKLTQKEVKLNRGKSVTLKAVMSPKTTTSLVTWTSSNEAVAVVDENGVVTAVSGLDGNDTAVITATTTNGLTAECTVTVKDVRSESLKLNKTELALNKGKSSTLKATMSKGTTDTVTWTSADEAIATVDAKGKVTAVALGTVTITATATSGLTAECTVTVKAPATKVVLNEKAVSINEGETLALEATVTPEDTTDTLTWKTSKASVATVSEDGVITAVAKGSATITVTTTSGKKATCKVTVLRPADSITLSATRVSVNKGKSVTLKATLGPNGTTDKVTWTSRNEDIMKVSAKGKVTGVSRGTAILVAETTSGVKAYCLVTVNVPATKVTLSEKKLTMAVGETSNLTATLTPITTTDGIATWTSSKESVVTVSEDGTVTAVAAGTAKITVKTTNGKSATCTITVK